MKLIGKKKAYFVSLGLLVMIFVFLWPLTGLDIISAQGGGQGGQYQWLGGLGGSAGLGAGGLMGLLGYSMTGYGAGMESVMANPLIPGFPTGVPGAVSMLGANPGMMGGTVYGGSGLYGMNGGMYGGLFGMNGGMYGGLFGMNGGMYGGLLGMYGGMYGMYGGLSPYSVLMAMPGQGFFIPGIPPEVDRTGASTFADAIADAKVPYFYGTGGSYYTPPLPYGITLHIDVIGYVYDADAPYLPIGGIKVGSKYSSTGYSVTTRNNGRFVLELFPGEYNLVFSKEGYKDEERLNVRVGVGMETLIVYMEKKINKKPVLDISSIEVIAGEKITLSSYALAHDPDGDPLTFSYSGWNANLWQTGSTYTTTDADIGSRVVNLAISDGKSSPTTDTLVINIYPGYEMVLYKGFNLISYPFENGNLNFSAFDLMEKLGGLSKIDSIMFYDNINDQYITAMFDSNGNATGVDFSIKIDQGYIIYTNEDITKKVINRYDGAKHPLELYKGMNLVGTTSYPDGYTSYQLLLNLKEKDVDSIYRYDPFWGDWESTYWLNGSPAGDIFPILKGEGYHIQIKESD